MSISGSVTLANLRLSTVTGTQFVDFSAANTLTPYLNWRLILTDSAGKKMVARILSAGTGETYDSELLSDPAFNDAGIWSAGANWAVADGKATASTASSTIYQSTPIASVGKCLLLSAVCDAYTSGTYRLRYMAKYEQVVSGTGTKTRYVTGYDIGTDIGILGTSLVASFTDISLKQVLTPSATGVTLSIISNEGINPNDASGYTYEIMSPRFKKSKFISQYNYFYRRNR
jgi:hypothetical protein